MDCNESYFGPSLDFSTTHNTLFKGNQPILSYKLTPYAADHDNFGIVAYLITNMEMEFRLSLLEKCLESHDKKLSQILLPFLPQKYSIGASIDDKHFFLKINNRSVDCLNLIIIKIFYLVNIFYLLVRPFEKAEDYKSRNLGK